MNLESVDQDQVVLRMPQAEAGDLLFTLEARSDELDAAEDLAEALRAVGVEPSEVETRTRSEYVPPAADAS